MSWRIDEHSAGGRERAFSSPSMPPAWLLQDNYAINLSSDGPHSRSSTPEPSTSSGTDIDGRNEAHYDSSVNPPKPPPFPAPTSIKERKKFSRKYGGGVYDETPHSAPNGYQSLAGSANIRRSSDVATTRITGYHNLNNDVQPSPPALPSSSAYTSAATLNSSASAIDRQEEIAKDRSKRQQTAKDIGKMLQKLETAQVTDVLAMILSGDQIENLRHYSDTAARMRRPIEKKDWNREFQKLLARPDDQMKFRKIYNLAHDFVYAASTYAKIIISELLLPESEKTIKPAPLGGIAGGTKYVVQNIMFKFVLDFELKPGLWMYGAENQRSDENAMKSASHELKGLMSYYSCNIRGLCFPLQALVDYKGFRVLAISILPINDETIIYGSSDAGKTVHASCSEFNEKIDTAARILNLKSHFINPSVQLSGPGDLEGHLGTDGKFYVLDAARTLPPEGPDENPEFREDRQVYYKLLRPEFVRKWSQPLCSDAFTSWQRYDNYRTENNMEVMKATKYLHEKLIPKFAERLDKMASSFSPLGRGFADENNNEGPSETFRVNRDLFAKKWAAIQERRQHEKNDISTTVVSTNFTSASNPSNGKKGHRRRVLSASQTNSASSSGHIPPHLNGEYVEEDTTSKELDIILMNEEMHRVGLNLRHLGEVRSHVKLEAPRHRILIEMVARVIKDLLRAHLRHKMREVRVLSEEPFKEVVIKVFNFVLGRSSASSRFWTLVKSKIKRKFKSALSSSEEAEDPMGLCGRMDMAVLFRRLEHLLGIALTESARNELEGYPDSFEFVDSDVREIYPKVKHMQIVDHAEGMALFLTAQRTSSGRRERLRQLRLSCEKFARALSTLPDSFTTLYQWGLALIEEAQMSAAFGAVRLYQRAADKFRSAVTINPQFQACFIKLGESYVELARAAIDAAQNAQPLPLPELNDWEDAGKNGFTSQLVPKSATKRYFIKASQAWERGLDLPDFFFEEVYQCILQLHSDAVSYRETNRSKSRQLFYGSAVLCEVVHSALLKENRFFTTDTGILLPKPPEVPKYPSTDQLVYPVSPPSSSSSHFATTSATSVVFSSGIPVTIPAPAAGSFTQTPRIKDAISVITPALKSRLQPVATQVVTSPYSTGLGEEFAAMNEQIKRPRSDSISSTPSTSTDSLSMASPSSSKLSSGFISAGVAVVKNAALNGRSSSTPEAVVMQPSSWTHFSSPNVKPLGTTISSTSLETPTPITTNDSITFGDIPSTTYESSAPSSSTINSTTTLSYVSHSAPITTTTMTDSPSITPNKSTTSGGVTSSPSASNLYIPGLSVSNSSMMSVSHMDPIETPRKFKNVLSSTPPTTSSLWMHQMKNDMHSSRSVESLTLHTNSSLSTNGPGSAPSRLDTASSPRSRPNPDGVPLLKIAGIGLTRSSTVSSKTISVPIDSTQPAEAPKQVQKSAVAPHPRRPARHSISMTSTTAPVPPQSIFAQRSVSPIQSKPVGPHGTYYESVEDEIQQLLNMSNPPAAQQHSSSSKAEVTPSIAFISEAKFKPFLSRGISPAAFSANSKGDEALYLKRILLDILAIWSDSLIQYAALKQKEDELLFVHGAVKLRDVINLDDSYLEIIQTKIIPDLQYQARDNRRIHFVLAALNGVIYEFDPSNTQVIYNMGESLHTYSRIYRLNSVKLHQLQTEAAECFAEALSLDPTYADEMIHHAIISQGSELESLMSMVEYSDALLKRTAELWDPSIRSVSLQGCTSIRNQTLLKLCTICPSQLSKLDLTKCAKLTDECLASMSTFLLNLTHLILADCTSIQDSGIQLFFEGQQTVGGSKLELLNLKGCLAITDASVLQVALHCPGLTHLDLEHCKITNNASSTLAQYPLPKLRFLSFALCVNGGSLSEMVKTKRFQLETIKLNGCNMSDDGVLGLVRGMPSITELHLASNYRLTNNCIIESFNLLPNLKILDVRNCKGLTWDVFVGISFDSVLHSLFAGRMDPASRPDNADVVKSRRKAKEIGMKALCQNASSLIALDLAESNMPEEPLHGIVHSISSKLTKLDLSSCALFSDEMVTVLASRAPHLKYLNLNGCFQLTSAGISAISRQCHELTELYLSRISENKDFSLREILESMPRLIKLDLSGNPHVTDHILSDIAAKVPNLEYLNATTCTKVTDIGVRCISEHLIQLTSLGLGGCVGVTNNALVSIAKHCRSLKELNISRCSITDPGITTLSEGVASLRIVDFDHLSLITDPALLHFVKHQDAVTELSIKFCTKLTMDLKTKLIVSYPSVKVKIEPTNNTMLVKELSEASKNLSSFRTQSSTSIDAILKANSSSPIILSPELQSKFDKIKRTPSPPPIQERPSTPVYDDPGQVSYKLDQLTSKDQRIRCNPLFLELYLSDEDFKIAFKMTKAEFAQLLPWKKKKLKEKLFLF